MKIDKLTNSLFAVLLLSSPLVVAESKYPASDFQPKVVYQDTDYKNSGSSSASSSSKSVADPKYPAANFQPEVLYQDKDYNHSEASSETVASVSSGSNASQANGDGSSGIPSEVLGVIVLALAGMVFYIKRSKFDTQSSAKAAGSTEENGATGVAAYLSRKIPKLSGVDKYLENRENYPSSGVAKYMAKKVVSIKEAAANKTTGVEKYVRKQG